MHHQNRLNGSKWTEIDQMTNVDRNGMNRLNKTALDQNGLNRLK